MYTSIMDVNLKKSKKLKYSEVKSMTLNPRKPDTQIAHDDDDVVAHHSILARLQLSRQRSYALLSQRLVLKTEFT